MLYSFKNFNIFGFHFIKRINNLNKKSFSTLNSIKQIGQPTIETHPYFFKPGDVTPGIKKNEYQERRIKLINGIIKSEQQNINDKFIIVIPSATKKYMSDKIPYVFRQNTEFLYLTGCQEPDCCLVIYSEPNKNSSVLFVRDKDAHSEQWDGPRTTPEAAVDYFGVDRSLPMEEFGIYLESILKETRKLGLWFDVMETPQINFQKILGKLVSDRALNFIGNPKPVIDQLRVIKSQSEMELMRRTCRIGSEAIIKTIEYTKPGLSEHEIFAKVDYECRVRGADYLAYPPVVAGGNRANIIHYITNNQIVNDKELILMDAGCEYRGYTSDITRTWPINGKFTKPQIELYEAVLDTQLEMINLCKKFPSLDYLFECMCNVLGKRLQEIGVISKRLDGVNLSKAAFKLCPHHVSHYLGMDVHDTPSVTRSIPIKPGMVVTVEPGVYINKNNKEVPDEFRGIGIRIEDDVLITENEPEVLTKYCPKSISEIEKICKK